MSIFFTSDLHLGHKRIQEFQPNRQQGTVDDHDNWIINNINNTCARRDWLFVLGDIALGDKERWAGLFARINPFLIFLVGNHDPQFPTRKPQYIEKHSVHYDPYVVLGLEHKVWIGRTLTDQFEVRLSHFPYNGDHTDESRYDEYRAADDGTVLLHGHTHSDKVISRSSKGTLQIHVGVDAWGGQPVPESEILGIIEDHA